MNFALPEPTAADVRELRSDALSLKAATEIIDLLAEIARKISPESICIYARRRTPELSLADALSNLADYSREVQAASAAHRQQFKAAADAERARLAPMVAAAARRVLAIQEALAGLDRRRAMSAADVETRRRRMIDATVPAVEIERLCPMPDRAAIDAERAALLNEQARLESFCRSGDESFLPPGFLAQVAQ